MKISRTPLITVLLYWRVILDKYFDYCYYYNYPTFLCFFVTPFPPFCDFIICSIVFPVPSLLGFFALLLFRFFAPSPLRLFVLSLRFFLLPIVWLIDQSAHSKKDSDNIICSIVLHIPCSLVSLLFLFFAPSPLRLFASSFFSFVSFYSLSFGW